MTIKEMIRDKSEREKRFTDLWLVHRKRER
jgi:hypothetical protein